MFQQRTPDVASQ